MYIRHDGHHVYNYIHVYTYTINFYYMYVHVFKYKQVPLLSAGRVAPDSDSPPPTEQSENVPNGRQQT